MFVALLALLVLRRVEADFKLSDSKLLLPYYSFNPVNYTLRGSDGACYDWSSATPEVATITPVFDPKDECSNSAVVTAVWQSPHRAVTTIHARVTSTGHIVKCDVIVDNIHRIEIETTTQELYLHNTPESLVAVGYDEFGNTFSTLDGVPFEWRIHGDTYSGAGDGHSVLRFLTWRESEYATPPGIAKLEQQGHQGGMQLVSGLRTGSAVVGVSLSEPVYNTVKASQVRLLVMANAQLSPALAYLIPNARIRLRVRVIQQGSDQEIRMPSSQYHLQVNDSNLATLDPEDGCTVTAKRFGQTQITLLDRNVEEALDNLRSVLRTDVSSETDLRLPRRRLPTSLIHIVEPAYLGFSLIGLSSTDSELCKRAAAISRNASGIKLTSVDSNKAGRDWIMEVNKLYSFVIDLYDQNSHRIYPTSNIRIELQVPKDKLEVIESSENGTFVILRPLQPGPVLVKALLRHLVDKDGATMRLDSPVEGSQQFVVYPSVRIQPPEVILPWPISAENSKIPDSNDGFQLQATGGSGQLTWVALPEQSVSTKVSQSNPVITITPTGQVSAQAFGEATVVALSSNHPHLCGTAKVVVTSPTSVRFVPGPAEVVVPDGPHLAMDEPEKATSKFLSGGLTDASVLAVGIAVLDSQGRSMTDCRRLNIPIRPLDENVLKVLPDRLLPSLAENINGTMNEPLACVRLLITGSQVGFTELEATFDPVENSIINATGQSPESSKLTSRFPVAVYQPLKFLNPISGKTHVAIGSTRHMLVHRGPRPWPLEPTSYFSRINAFDKGTKKSDVQDSHPVITRKPELWQSSTIEQPVDLIDSQTRHISPILHDRKSRLMTFSLRCKEVGAYEFVLQIGNRPSSLNPVPLVMSTKFTVVCDVAERLRLVLYRPTLSLPPGVPACPLLNASVPEPSDVLDVPNTVPLVVGLAFFNAEGIELDAVDSLSTSVSITDTTSTSGITPSTLVRDPKPSVQIPSDQTLSLLGQPTRPYFTIKPRSLGVSTGLLSIHAEACSTFHPSSSVASALDSSLNIRLNPLAKFLPGDHLRILHHPKVDMSFSVVGGSGHFFISTASSALPEAAPKLRLLPMKNSSPDSIMENAIPLHNYRIQSNQVGQAKIHVIDRCFPSLNTNPARMQPVELTLTVDIVGLSALRLQAADRIPLGGQTTVVLQAIDSRGDPLPYSFTQFLDVRVYQSTDYQDLNKDDSKILGLPDGGSLTKSHWIGSSGHPSDLSRAHFDVRGQNLGSANLVASTETFSQESSHTSIVRSNTLNIQVFPPLSLSPCQFNLLIGAEYEIRALGGPQPALVEFTLSDESTASKHVSIIRASKNSVLLRAGTIPGLATVHGRAISLSSRSNASDWNPKFTDTAVSSEASCSFNVVTLSGVRIGCPLASTVERVRALPGGSHVKPQSDDERYLIACRSDDPARGCGITPLWVEGLTTSVTTDRKSWSLHSAFTNTNAEPNQTINDLVSPLSMSGVSPPLRFVWQLDPPQPTSVARLVHLLEGFNVTPNVMHSASGMMLVGQVPGRVTVHVVVEATNQNAGQLIGSNGQSVQRLHAQLTVIILPQLGLVAPAVPSPYQLLMSRNSRFSLQPWADVISNNHVVYEVSVVQDNLNISCGDEGFRVSVDGTIQAPVRYRTSDHSHECHTLIKLSSWPKEHSGAKTSLLLKDRPLSQTMFVDVVVKEPRYLLAVPIPGEYLQAKGLPVGGPYRFAITYHDELGRTFDSVSDAHTHLNIDLNRIDAFDAHLDSPLMGFHSHPTGAFDRSAQSTTVNFAGFPFSASILTIRALPGSANTNSRKSQSNVPTVIRLDGVDSVGSFSASYLGLVAGGELDMLSQTSLFVSQWLCLPELKGDGIWSSSDPTIFWVDSRNRVLLARRPGKAYLLYSLKPSIVSSPLSNITFSKRVDHSTKQMTYLITMEVSLLLSDPKSTIQLVYANTEETAIETGPVFLPILSHFMSGGSLTSGVLRLPIRLMNRAGESEGNHPTCSFKIDESRRSLASVAPLQCYARMSAANHPASTLNRNRLVPDWLSLLLLWNQNETMHTVLDLDTDSPSLINLITTQLEPLFPSSPFYSGASQWQCVMRPTVLWEKYAQMFGLVLEPGTRLSMELKSADAPHESSPVLARMDVIPLPGFQMVVPPAMASGSDTATSTHIAAYHYRITEPRTHRRLLVFVPPITADALTLPALGRDHLYARSKNPDILQVASSPRPISTLTEVSQVLMEYERSLSMSNNLSPNLSGSLKSALNMWRMLSLEQVQHIDNDATVISDDTLIKRHLLWIVDLKANIAQSATNTIVDVVISLRPTGQHTVIPVHIVLPAADDESLAALNGNHSWLSFFGFSWIHLFALILLTLLIAIVGHVVSRSSTLVSNSSGTGSSAAKNLPSVVPPSLISPLRSSPRKLWSQGYTISPSRASMPISLNPTRPLLGTSPQNYASNTHPRFRSAESPVVSDSGDLLFEEQRWRNALSGNSPSRLRNTFDSI